MIRLRRALDPPVVTIKPPLGARANAAMVRSISPVLRISIGLSSTPNDPAALWMAANWATEEVKVGSRRIAARVTRGAISLSSSTDFPLVLYSDNIKPVALPPGRATLTTNPAPTGSVTFVNTIGKLRVRSEERRVGKEDRSRSAQSG